MSHFNFNFKIFKIFKIYIFYYLIDTLLTKPASCKIKYDK